MRPEIIEGDVQEVLKTLDDESVQCVGTSPPYWGLRDYGTATWEGGDEDCEHTVSMDPKYSDPKKKTAALAQRYHIGAGMPVNVAYVVPRGLMTN